MKKWNELTANELLSSLLELLDLQQAQLAASLNVTTDQLEVLTARSGPMTKTTQLGRTLIGLYNFCTVNKGGEGAGALRQQVNEAFDGVIRLD